MTPTTVSEAFIKWMEDNGYGTFGQNIFLNQVPDDDADSEPINSAYWVVTSGGAVTQRNVTAQSIQQFVTNVFYRDPSGEVVEKNLFALNQKVNTRGCFTLEGFDLYDITATLPADNDRDAENRRQGSFSVSMQIYMNYVS